MKQVCHYRLALIRNPSLPPPEFRFLTPSMSSKLLTALLLYCAASALCSAAEPPPIPASPATEKAHPAAIPLWLKGAPGSESRSSEAEKVDWRQEPDIVFPVTSNIHNPSIIPFLPAKGKATGAAVIIAPGGGHMFLTIDREGYDLGEWLANRGIAAFVLKYRLARDQSNHAGTPQPYKIDVEALADAQRAVRLIRSRAAEWKVNPARVGILGFSAGGEIALLTALREGSANAAASDSVERASARPDFFALIYPGGLTRSDIAVPAQGIPPAFLLCAFDDRMPEGLSNFFISLKKAGVNAELHIYNSGGHGFGVRPRPLAVSEWPSRFVDWLNDRGFLKME